MNEFFSSFGYIKAGFALILKPGIRLYVLLPLAVNLLLFGLVIAFGAHSLSNFIAWLVGQFAWAEWFTWLLWPLFAILCLTVVFFAFSLLANLIAAPFNGRLAQAVEDHLSQEKEIRRTSPLGEELVAALRSEYIKFKYFALRALPLLLLFLVPLINVTAAPFIWFLFGAWMMSLEYLEYPMSNHGLFFPQVKTALVKRRKMTMGYGIAVMLLTMTPLINFIAMPVAVCGATKLWLDKLKEAQAPSELDTAS